jgi:hypothetical protein
MQTNVSHGLDFRLQLATCVSFSFVPFEKVMVYGYSQAYLHNENEEE